MPDEILTLPEVAELLKVGQKTLYTLAQRRRLPAFKVLGQWRFKRVDIDRWIEEQKSAVKEFVPELPAPQTKKRPKKIRTRRGR
ncbi:helix-turn-helix domain-containing protein [Bauldia litoralis]|uniref:helix-turn-helix domain-containing protein n=1 Tax=Bauldia litoralis TaxID=665467 RepID=UPI000B8875D7|nr:helix-turn-helix domain-containing protein [Bauldia litoralis]